MLQLDRVHAAVAVTDEADDAPDGLAGVAVYAALTGTIGGGTRDRD